MDLTLILGPTVIATVISSLFVSASSKRSRTNSYITAERAAWRLRVKEAMIKLLESFGDTKETEIALQRIKSELNPQGRLLEPGLRKESKLEPKLHKFLYRVDEERDYFMKDSHIWAAIAAYEDQPDNRSHLNALLTLLEFALKYDWERSKGEVIVKINKYLIISISISLFGIVFYITSLLDFWEPAALTYWDYSVILITIVFYLAFALSPYFIFRSNRDIVAACIPIVTLLGVVPAYFFQNWGHYGNGPIGVLFTCLIAAGVFSLKPMQNTEDDRQKDYVAMVNRYLEIERIKNTFVMTQDP